MFFDESEETNALAKRLGNSVIVFTPENLD